MNTAAAETVAATARAAGAVVFAPSVPPVRVLLIEAATPERAGRIADAVAGLGWTIDREADSATFYAVLRA